MAHNPPSTLRHDSSSSSEPLIQMEDIVLERNNVRILDQVDLRIAHGDQLLIQGPSGAGKTSLFAVLGLLTPPTAGQHHVAGTETRTLSERHRARLRRDTIGIVFQDFHLIPDLTARENATLPQEHAGQRDPEWIDTLFDTLDIRGLATAYPHTLSGGEKQRIAIARALANKPDLVLADEPTGQLDPDTADRVLDLLLSLQEDTGAALALISHDRTIADRFATVHRLVAGQIESAHAATPVQSETPQIE